MCDASVKRIRKVLLLPYRLFFFWAYQDLFWINDPYRFSTSYCRKLVNWILSHGQFSLLNLTYRSEKKLLEQSDITVLLNHFTNVEYKELTCVTFLLNVHFCSIIIHDRSKRLHSYTYNNNSKQIKIVDWNLYTKRCWDGTNDWGRNKSIMLSIDRVTDFTRKVSNTFW